MYGIQENKNPKDIILESNHSHFILIDYNDQEEDTSGREILFRSRLEAELINESLKSENPCKISRIPMIKICIHGGFDTLQFCKEALKQQVPVLILSVIHKLIFFCL